jgi:hypothetical protein
VVGVLKSVTDMRVKLRTWVAAACIAAVSGLAALYLTQPSAPPLSSSSPSIGRDHPSVNAPNPLTADEIGYRVPRDKIKAIDAPTFMAAGATGSVPDRLPVIGVTEGGQARAYPIPLLSRVEIVNDQVGGRTIAVTW